jgi:cytochrome c556
MHLYTHARLAAGTAMIAAAILLGSFAVRAQQPPPAPPQPPPAQGGGRGPGAGAPAARAPMPVAASSVAGHPETYYGEYVSITGAVESLLSKTAFSIDQDKTKSTGKEVLILAPSLIAAADPNTYVTVLGELMKFDPDEVTKKAKGYTLDLPADAIEKFRGRPVVIATAVINDKLTDIAKKPLPPMTTEELALQKLMKTIAPASAAVRNADAGTADATKQNIAALKQAFADTEAFWKTKGKADAVQFAADARKHVATMEAAAGAGKWDEVKTSAGTLGQTCQGCHAAHRERLEDGTYRIKTGG